MADSPTEIYLDHNSTTPLLPEVVSAMAEWQGQRFGNPASAHQAGRRARQALEQAREDIGRMLGADTERAGDRVIFTSGGTEANHLAVLGVAGRLAPHTPPHEAIVSAIEHTSVRGLADLLERRGWLVHRLPVTRQGVVDLARLEPLLNERTRLASIMLANSETGVVQPVARIVERCAPRGIVVHTDAAQGVGKLPVDFRSLGVHLLSVAPHKFHGPLGIGALVVRGDVELEPLLVGGSQQTGLRAGTESVALAVGFRAALAAWQRDRTQRTARLARQRNELEAAMQAALGDALAINGAGAERLPQTSNMAFLGYDRQALLMALDLAGLCCSAGSACASGSSEPSAVLKAMGCSDAALRGSLRFSLGATTTDAEIEEAIARMVATCRKLPRGGPATR
jgi:cysteine desulfurase